MILKLPPTLNLRYFFSTYTYIADSSKSIGVLYFIQINLKEVLQFKDTYIILRLRKQ